MRFVAVALVVLCFVITETRTTSGER